MKDEYYEEVIRAYKQASFGNFILKSLKDNKVYSFIEAALFLLSTISLFANYFELFVFFALLSIVVAYKIGDITSERMCKDKPIFNLYRTNRQGARYCIFAAELKDKNITDVSRLQKIKSILEKDLELKNDFMKRPFSYIIIASFIASMGGFSSTKYGLIVVIILFIFLLATLIIGDPIYSRRRELLLFLEWYILEIENL